MPVSRLHLTHHRRGLMAETLATVWLMCKGYRILTQRFKTPIGEIDLIAKRGQTIAFIEVKARRKARDAAEAIHTHNQQRVTRAAQYYLQAHPELQHCTIRFDAVLVAWYRWPYHLPQAF